MALKEHGVEAFGRLIDQNVAQARHLADLVEAEPALELTAPVEVNIVCFRHRLAGGVPAAVKALNVAIMLRLRAKGIAALSATTANGGMRMRVATANTIRKTTWRGRGGKFRERQW